MFVVWNMKSNDEAEIVGYFGTEKEAIDCYYENIGKYSNMTISHD